MWKYFINYFVADERVWLDLSGKREYNLMAYEGLANDEIL
jgi:hypothetical protein